MHKKPPYNPYEPSVRERLAQRDVALRTHAYKATGKRKCAVSKPLDYSAKKELNSMYGGSKGYSIYYQHTSRAFRQIMKQSYIIIDYETLGPYPTSIEEKWLTERQATMMRLKGYVVEEV